MYCKYLVECNAYACIHMVSKTKKFGRGQHWRPLSDQVTVEHNLPHLARLSSPCPCGEPAASCVSWHIIMSTMMSCELPVGKLPSVALQLQYNGRSVQPMAVFVGYSRCFNTGVCTEWEFCKPTEPHMQVDQQSRTTIILLMCCLSGTSLCH